MKMTLPTVSGGIHTLSWMCVLGCIGKTCTHILRVATAGNTRIALECVGISTRQKFLDFSGEKKNERRKRNTQRNL